MTGDKGPADGESRPQMMLESGSNGLTRIIDAELVQSVERQFRNLHVGGSIPPFGSKHRAIHSTEADVTVTMGGTTQKRTFQASKLAEHLTTDGTGEEVTVAIVLDKE